MVGKSGLAGWLAEGREFCLHHNIFEPQIKRAPTHFFLDDQHSLVVARINSQCYTFQFSNLLKRLNFPSTFMFFKYMCP